MLLASASLVAQATIATGPHDLSAGSAVRTGDLGGQTCVFCHTPHGGSATVPLWNRNAPTTTYTLYTSTTMDAAQPTQAQMRSGVSGACLSCHDGTIGLDVLVNYNGLPHAASATFAVQGTAKSTYGGQGTGANNLMTGGLPYLGNDLANDHPVAIIYETARAATATEFVTQTNPSGTKVVVPSASGDLPLFGGTTATATVECASCHNPHNNTQGNFLRKSNAASAICLTCHIK